MEKRLITLLILSFCFTSILSAQARLNPDDFKIAGIALSSSPAEVTRILGTPLSIKKRSRDDDLGAARVEKWHYPGLEIQFVAWKNGSELKPGHIESIDVSDAKYRTRRGIRVGDTRDRVLTAYGRPLEADSGDEPTLTFAEEPVHSCIAFELKQGKVARVQVAVYYWN